MIYISGMEGGSGAGEAASRKAGWLRGGRRSAAQSAAAQLLDTLNTAIANRARAYGTQTSAPAPPAPRRGSARSFPDPAPEDRPRRPEFTPDGRPLPPDGSTPPPRGAVTAGAGAPADTPAEFGADGRPLPPDGSAPPARPRPETGSIPAGEAAPPSGARMAPGSASTTGRTPPAPRIRGAPLPPGTAPAAPVGHTFASRPVPAPPGEFLFDVRCSCGAGMLAPVKLDDLRRAAARGLSPAAAIAIATQDALDAMHCGR
ncbi:MAG TPA: hypothetical protein VKV26_24450 [Dehalococcoidia bacterium]|nr:hypothetical protein [Dehalococcoidia bacterium]